MAKKKNAGGAPPKYKDPKEMQTVIDDYFDRCKGKAFINPDTGFPSLTDKGHIIWDIPPKPPTVTGLALALGFTSRQALLNYQAKKEFVDTVTRAKSRVEEYAESRLFDKDGANGAKFSLANNFDGWREKQDVNVEGSMNTKSSMKVKFEGELDDWAK